MRLATLVDPLQILEHAAIFVGPHTSLYITILRRSDCTDTCLYMPSFGSVYYRPSNSSLAILPSPVGPIHMFYINYLTLTPLLVDVTVY